MRWVDAELFFTGKGVLCLPFIQNAPLDPHFITFVCVALDTGCSAQNENQEKEKKKHGGLLFLACL
ncbi:hypothetical protein EBU71_18700 [bacterium]|nr:hypothetical protein [Candidatus Elulimicrobium humile]